MDKNYITFGVNQIRVNQLHLCQEKRDKLFADCKNLTINDTNKICKIGYDKLVLQGQRGEIAYVINDTSYSSAYVQGRNRGKIKSLRKSFRNPDKISLIIKFPLTFSIRKNIRNWCSYASKFFKPQFISNYEIIKSGQDPHYIKNKPHSTLKFSMCSLKRGRKKKIVQVSPQMEMRTRRTSECDGDDRKIENRKQNLTNRNTKIKAYIKKLENSNHPSLKKQIYLKVGRKFNLSQYTIRNITNPKS